MKQNEFELHRHVGNERMKRLRSITGKYMKMCEMYEPTHSALLTGKTVQDQYTQRVGRDVLDVTKNDIKAYLNHYFQMPGISVGPGYNL